MRTIVTYFLVVALNQAFGQVFEKIDSIALISDYPGLFADFDNNGDFDFLNGAFLASDSSAFFVQPYSDVGLKRLSAQNLFSKCFSISDFDNDNKLDLLFQVDVPGSVNTIIGYQKEGLDTLILSKVSDGGFTESTDVDLNNDGRKELAFARNDSLIIYAKADDNSWVMTNQHIAINDQSRWLFYDNDMDGWQDLIVTLNEQVVLYHNNFGNLLLKDTLTQLESVVDFKAADFNDDGLFDIVSIKNDSVDNLSIELLLSDTKIVVDQRLNYKYKNAFAADFNSDGRCDVLVAVNEGVEDKVVLYLNSGDSTFLNLIVPVEGSFTDIDIADFDYDGDLDFGLLKSDINSPYIEIYNNISTPKNSGPSIPAEHWSFSTAEGVVLAWTPSMDDHTSRFSLTYDVFVGSSTFNGEQVAPNFDLESTLRFLPTRGNAGFREEIRISELLGGTYYYGIQSIDNALHYLLKEEGGEINCNGRLIACGEFEVCDPGEVRFETKEVCLGSEVTLEMPDNVGWYSANKGLLGSGTQVTIVANNPDTIYVSGCEFSNFIINPATPSRVFNSADTIVCAGTQLTFNKPLLSDSILWSINNLSDQVNTASFQFLAHDSLSVLARSFKNGCSFTDTLNVIVGTIALEVPTHVTIRKGESVVLNATGATLYEWSPKESLDDPFSAEVTASPRRSTVYTVTGIDEAGCQESKEVTVTVIDRGWIPTLFTPNGDGQNDKLLVYGLEAATDFELNIYNRSGSLMYSTQSVAEAISSGWDGTVNSVKQPNGVYYWKVSGRLADGTPLILNEKESGVVYLMR